MQPNLPIQSIRRFNHRTGAKDCSAPKLAPKVSVHEGNNHYPSVYANLAAGGAATPCLNGRSEDEYCTQSVSKRAGKSKDSNVVQTVSTILPICSLVSIRAWAAAACASGKVLSMTGFTFLELMSGSTF